MRDPELYYFSIFGSPSANAPWGWHVEAHHLSLDFTVVDRALTASAPAFFGANPAEVRTGTRQGLPALAEEEDLARELLASLDAEQRVEAIIATTAATRVHTRPSRPIGAAHGPARPHLAGRPTP